MHSMPPHALVGVQGRGGCSAGNYNLTPIPDTPLHPSGSDGTEAAFNRIRDAVRIPMYGCDCYAYGLLASGLVDLVVEADLKPYDYMALIPIIKVWRRKCGESVCGGLI